MNTTPAFQSNVTLTEQCLDFTLLAGLGKAFGVICILLSVIGTISNILICVIYKEHITKTTSVSNQYFIVVCLALADLLSTAILIPVDAKVYLTLLEESVFSKNLMVLYNAVWYCLTTLSLYMLLLMTLERLISVKFPFYQLKKRHIVYAVISVCIYCLTVFLFYYFLQEVSEDRDYFFIIPYWAELFGLFVNNLIPSFANVAIYLYLFRIAKIQQRRIQQLTIEIPHQPSQQSINKKRKNSNIRKNNKIYQNVMTLFCVTWIPFLVFNIYTFIDISFHITCVGSVIDSFTSTLVFMNNACNGLVYTVASKSFRHKLLGLIKKS